MFIKNQFKKNANKSKACFETGLFLIGISWADKTAKPEQFVTVVGQAQASLDILNINKDFVKKATSGNIVSSNVNDRLRWVAGTMDMVKMELQPIIEDKYGNKATHCFQVGVDLGNLTFASGILAAAGMDAMILRPFLDNLQNSCIRIGEPDVLKDFITYCEKLLTSSIGGSDFANVAGKAITCAQKLSIWIEINIDTKDAEGTPNQGWEKIAGYSFGVVFVIVMLVINVFIPNPSSTQYETFKIVLALAAAGIGGVLAGFIQIKGTFNKIAFRAGGALALFLVVFFAHPGMPEPSVRIHQTINGNNGTQIGENKGVINIGHKAKDTEDVEK